MTIRVMLADDHKILREALRTVLDREADISVVAEANDGLETLRIAKDVLPEIIVMDIGMPGMGGIEAAHRLQKEHPEIKVLALSTFFDRKIVQQMLEAGASGYVAKSAGGDELLRGIRAVAMGNTYLSPEIAAVVVDSMRDKNHVEPIEREQLGRREREVLGLLADGKTSSEIGILMHIATSTVDVHRRNIMRKLDLHNVAELTKYAVRKGIVTNGL